MTELLLIDLSSIVYPAWHTSGGDTNPDAVSLATVDKVRRMASGQPHVAICCDSGKSFRNEIDPQYKANREAKPEALRHQYRVAMETLASDGFPVWSAKGFEADDILATATRMALERDGQRVLVASSDKDLYALVGPRVSYKRLSTGDTLDVDAVVKIMGVWPEQITDYLSLVGDASDNIKGADKIGAVKAAELLKTFPFLEDIYRAIDEKTASFKPATLAGLAEFRPRMETVRSLVRMRTDVPLPNFEDAFKPRVPKDAEEFGKEDSMSDDTGDLFAQPEAKTAPEANPLRAEPAREGASDAPDANKAEAPAPAKAPLVEATPEPMALVRHEPAVAATPVEWNMQLEPRSLEEAKQLARWAFESTFLSAYPNPQAAFMVILAGRELNIQAQASLRAFHIIEGKPRMAADLIRSLVMRSGKAKIFRCIERTGEAATFEAQRTDDDFIHKLRFTIEDGRLAFRGDPKDWTAEDTKAWKKSGWGRNPADMCVARAGSKIARLVWPEIANGLYSIEELSDSAE